jgi:hypothetical protein
MEISNFGSVPGIRVEVSFLRRNSSSRLPRTYARAYSLFILPAHKVSCVIKETVFDAMYLCKQSNRKEIFSHLEQTVLCT